MGDANEWRTGLTEADAAKVEKAARTAFDLDYPGSRWDETGQEFRDRRYRTHLAALRAIGVLPELPKRTRGMELAEKHIAIFCEGSEYGPFVKMYGRPDAEMRPLSNHPGQVLLERLRACFAYHIDAERDAALEAAAELVTRNLDWPGETADKIRALKTNGGRP